MNDVTALTGERIAGIKARLAAATAGPWAVHNPRSRFHIISTVLPAGRDFVMESGSADEAADAELIANAPTDIAELLGEVERLRAVVASFTELRAIHADDLAWDRAFADPRSEALLEKMSAEALAEHRAGRTISMDELLNLDGRKSS
jgi:hypothetical protein